MHCLNLFETYLVFSKNSSVFFGILSVVCFGEKVGKWERNKKLDTGKCEFFELISRVFWYLQ